MYIYFYLKALHYPDATCNSTFTCYEVELLVKVTKYSHIKHTYAQGQVTLQTVKTGTGKNI